MVYIIMYLKYDGKNIVRKQSWLKHNNRKIIFSLEIFGDDCKYDDKS